MTGQGQQPVMNPGRVPRTAPRRDAILRLIDGTRTARQIALALDVHQKNVRAVAQAHGISHLLLPASGAPIAARLPFDLVLRDLSLSPEVAAWLRAQMAGGALMQDVIRGIVNDAYQEETGP